MSNSLQLITKKHENLVFFSFIILVSAIKLIVISANEIIAEPDDASGYVSLAAKYYWMGALPTRPAGYPLWLAFINLTGIPLRIVAELLLLFCCFIFSYTLRRFRIGLGVCSMVFLFMVFHPFSLSFLDRAMTETFYAPVLILSLSLIFLSIKSETRKKTVQYSCLSGFCFAVLWNTREENILITLIFAQILISIVALCLYNKTNKKDCLKKCLIIMAPLLIILTAINIIVCSINYSIYGYWGQGSVMKKYFKSSLIALTKIKPSKPIRRAAITKEAREMAYEVSPTFRNLRPYIEDKDNPHFASSKYVGVEGEIGTGHFLFTVRDAVRSVYYSNQDEGVYADLLREIKKNVKKGEIGHLLTTLRKAIRFAHDYTKKDEEIYLSISNEINDAIKKGIIPGRTVLHPYIDPAYKTWIPHLPESFMRICKLFVKNYKPLMDNHYVLSQNMIDKFDNITNRRPDLLEKGPLSGWVFIPGHEIERIELHPAGNKGYHGDSNYVLSSSDEFLSRPDVVKELSDINPPMKTGFMLPAVHGRFNLNELNLVLHLKDNSKFIIKSPQQGEFINYTESGTNRKSYYRIENFPLNLNNFQKMMYKIQTGIGYIYCRIILWFSILGVPLSLVTIILFRQTNSFIFTHHLILVNIFLIILSIVCLVAIIDDSLWPVEEARYLFVCLLFYSGFIILLMGNALNSFFNYVQLKC